MSDLSDKSDWSDLSAAKAAATTIVDMRIRLANDTARAAAAEFHTVTSEVSSELLQPEQIPALQLCATTSLLWNDLFSHLCR